MASTGEIIKGETYETPVAVGTKLAWVLSGVVADIPRSLLSAVNLTTTHPFRVECQSQVVGDPNTDSVLDRKVNELFKLETLGKLKSILLKKPLRKTYNSNRVITK